MCDSGGSRDRAGCGLIPAFWLLGKKLNPKLLHLSQQLHSHQRVLNFHLTSSNQESYV